MPMARIAFFSYMIENVCVALFPLESHASIVISFTPSSRDNVWLNQVVKLGITQITFLPHPPEGGDITETMREFAQTVKPAVEHEMKRGMS